MCKGSARDDSLHTPRKLVNLQTRKLIYFNLNPIDILLATNIFCPEKNFQFTPAIFMLATTCLISIASCPKVTQNYTKLPPKS